MRKFWIPLQSLCFFLWLGVLCRAENVPGYLYLEGAINRHFLESSASIPVEATSRIEIKSKYASPWGMNAFVSLHSFEKHASVPGSTNAHQVWYVAIQGATMQFRKTQGSNYESVKDTFVCGSGTDLYQMQEDDLLIAMVGATSDMNWCNDAQLLYDSGVMLADDMVAQLRKRYFLLPATVLVFRFSIQPPTASPNQAAIPTESPSRTPLVFLPHVRVSMPSHENVFYDDAQTLSLGNYPMIMQVQLYATAHGVAYVWGSEGSVDILRADEFTGHIRFTPTINRLSLQTLFLQPNDIVICMVCPKDSTAENVLLAIRKHLIASGYQHLQDNLNRTPDASLCSIKIARVITDPTKSALETTNSNAELTSQSSSVEGEGHAPLRFKPLVASINTFFEEINNTQKIEPRHLQIKSSLWGLECGIEVTLDDSRRAHITLKEGSGMAVIRKQKLTFSHYMADSIAETDLQEDDILVLVNTSSTASVSLVIESLGEHAIILGNAPQATLNRYLSVPRIFMIAVRVVADTTVYSIS